MLTCPPIFGPVIVRILRPVPVGRAQTQEQRQFVLGRVGPDGPARQVDLLGRPAREQLADPRQIASSGALVNAVC